MSWSREEALTDPAIRQPVIFISEFRFSLREIPTEITTRLYRPIHSGKIVARRSHDISIAELTNVPSEPENGEDAPSEGEVLHKSVLELVSAYNAARAQGLTPSPSWLKVNSDFQ